MPNTLTEKLRKIAERAEDVLAYGEMFGQAASSALRPLVDQARILVGQFYAIVTNPPYMGRKSYNKILKRFINSDFKKAKADLYGAFVMRNLELVRRFGSVGMITIPNWMFLSTFQKLRAIMLENHAIGSLIHNGRGVWGSDFGSCSFVIRRFGCKAFKGAFRKLFEVQGSVATNEELERRFHAAQTHYVSSDDFFTVPGSPIAYWVSERLREAFQHCTRLGRIAESRLGMATGDNDNYVRLWHEVNCSRIGFGCHSREEANSSGKKWFPYNKGGEFRRWYGNNDCLVDWENDGHRLQTTKHPSGRIWAHNFNLDHIFRPSVTWTFVSSTYFGIRQSQHGFLFDVGGSSAFPSEKDLDFITGLLCSKTTTEFLRAINPSLNFQAGNIGAVPVLPIMDNQFKKRVAVVVRNAIQVAKADWDSFECSWDFKRFPFLKAEIRELTLEGAFGNWAEHCNAAFLEMLKHEAENNRLFIKAYGLQDELSPEVSENQITLYRPNREEDIKRLISYTIGCTMGRYSLDKPGLIYAHSGNERFWEIYHEKQEKAAGDQNKNNSCDSWSSFPPDQDGIIPITDTDWFEDDAANRACYIEVSLVDK